MSTASMLRTSTDRGQPAGLRMGAPDPLPISTFSCWAHQTATGSTQRSPQPRSDSAAPSRTRCARPAGSTTAPAAFTQPSSAGRSCRSTLVRAERLQGNRFGDSARTLHCRSGQGDRPHRVLARQRWRVCVVVLRRVTFPAESLECRLREFGDGVRELSRDCVFDSDMRALPGRRPQRLTQQERFGRHSVCVVRNGECAGDVADIDPGVRSAEPPFGLTEHLVTRLLAAFDRNLLEAFRLDGVGDGVPASHPADRSDGAGYRFH